jgi:ubiquinone biosynthesis protein UbiJ
MSQISFLDSLKPLAGRALEAALNRALALDVETQAALKPLGGQRVALHLQAPPLALEIRVRGERLEVGPALDESEPDLSVRGTIGGLLSQLPFFRRDDAPQIGKLRVSGDAELARRLQTLAQRFDPDWQQPFVAVFGEVAGVQVANAARGALKQMKTLGASFADGAANYVVEESRDVVGRAELDAFHNDVDALRDGVERIAARVARLSAGVA